MPSGNDGVSLARLKGHVVETGQVVEINAPRRRKRKRGWREHVGMLDLELMTKLELTGGESRVFFCLLKHVPERGGAESFVFVEEIAQELGVSGQYVSQIMKRLRDRQIVFTIRQGKHRVNTWLAYNGDFESWNSEAEKDPEPVWVRGANAETGEMK